MACRHHQLREDIDITTKGLLLPDGVSIRDTERGKILVINQTIIYFYHAKAVMYTGYENTFLLAKDVLDMNPSVDMILERHTSKKSKAYPYNLSVDRSKTSFNYLKNLGVNANRLIMIGLGEELPEHNTDAKNRRIEFIIIKY